MHWGLVADGNCWHVVPMVNIDGEVVPSAAHNISKTCHCTPFAAKGKGGWDVWQHFDPDHPGALSYEEWIMERRKAMAEANNKEVG